MIGYRREIDTRSCLPTRPRLAQHGHTKTLKLLFPSGNGFEAIFSSTYKWKRHRCTGLNEIAFDGARKWNGWSTQVQFCLPLKCVWPLRSSRWQIWLLKPVRIIQVLVLTSMTTTCLVWKLQELYSYKWSSVINTHDSTVQYPFIEMKSLTLWCGSSCAQFGTKYILSCDYIKYILNPIKQKVFWYSCQVSMISMWSRDSACADMVPSQRSSPSFQAG